MVKINNTTARATARVVMLESGRGNRNVFAGGDSTWAARGGCGDLLTVLRARGRPRPGPAPGRAVTRRPDDTNRPTCPSRRTSGRQTHRRNAPRRQGPPRSEAAGCTWPPDPYARVRRT